MFQANRNWTWGIWLGLILLMSSQLATAQPTFTEHAVDLNYTGAVAASTADMDGDGDLDLAVASWLLGTLAWYENDGTQNFTKHSVSGSTGGARSVLVEQHDGSPLDLDGDGDVDILAAGYTAHEVAWWSNDGAMNFTKITIATGHSGATRWMWWTWNPTATWTCSARDTTPPGTKTTAP